MSKKTITPADLNQFYGTSKYYYHPLYPTMNYTDGVQWLAEQAGCYWLLNIIGTEIHPLQKREPFLSIVVKVTEKDGSNRAFIEVTDGNTKTLYTRKIDFTDMPVGDWKFYLTNDVLMVPMEY